MTSTTEKTMSITSRRYAGCVTLASTASVVAASEILFPHVALLQIESIRWGIIFATTLTALFACKSSASTFLCLVILTALGIWIKVFCELGADELPVLSFVILEITVLAGGLIISSRGTHLSHS